MRDVKLYILVFSIALAGCKKLVEVAPPVTRITGESVFNSNANAIAVLNGLYASAGSIENELATSSSLFALSSDEFILWDGMTDVILNSFYTNSLFAFSASGYSAGDGFWTICYKDIYVCNDALEGIEKAKKLNVNVKRQLTGEAKFMRGIYYFYLVNLYGKVPLVLGTDFRVNATLSRSDTSLVYDQIIKDLTEAKELLADNFPDNTLLHVSNERVRPTRWAAAALLARVYLYYNDMAGAEREASQVIDNTSLFGLTDLNSTFLANSMEAIWQIQSTTNYNTADAFRFIIPSIGPNSSNYLYLSNSLLRAFEKDDQRMLNWVDSVVVDPDTFYYPYKYKENAPDASVTEHNMILRLAEQYLIRAEARAVQNNIPGSQDDLNMIRSRAGLGNTTANDKASLLKAILHERQVELFTESGHRWLDLKRTGTVDAVMSVATPLKGGTWNTHWKWYPLPAKDVLSNVNLDQNEGY